MKNRPLITCFTLIAILSAALYAQDTTHSVPAAAAEKAKKALLIIDLKNSSGINDPELGQGIAAIFTEEFDNTGFFTVIPRAQVMKVMLREKDLSLSAATKDQVIANRIANLSNADLVMTGSIADFSISKSGTPGKKGMKRTSVSIALDVALVENLTGKIAADATGEAAVNLDTPEDTVLGLPVDFSVDNFGRTTFGRVIYLAVQNAIAKLARQVGFKTALPPEAFSTPREITVESPKQTAKKSIESAIPQPPPAQGAPAPSEQTYVPGRDIFQGFQRVVVVAPAYGMLPGLAPSGGIAFRFGFIQGRNFLGTTTSFIDNTATGDLNISHDTISTQSTTHVTFVGSGVCWYAENLSYSKYHSLALGAEGGYWDYKKQTTTTARNSKTNISYPTLVEAQHHIYILGPKAKAQIGNRRLFLTAEYTLHIGGGVANELDIGVTALF